MNDKLVNKLFPCPCCQEYSITELGNYEICSVCGWEDDPIQSSDPNYSGGANSHSLEEARKLWDSNK